MQTFDDIYIVDLHGNANKKEKSLEGGEDKNVFDIKTGVAIFIGIKRKNKSEKKSARIFRADIFGTRSEKFDYLDAGTQDNIQWQTVVPMASKYAWLQQDEKVRGEYEKSFLLNELFVLKNTGVVTKRDNLCIQDTPEDVWQSVRDFLELPELEVRRKYKIAADVRDWKYEWAKKDLLDSGPSEEKIVPISYRPFDTRYIYYTGRARGFVGWPVERIGRHYIGRKNMGLLVTKALRDADYHHIFVTDTISEVIFLSGITASNAINMPLYVYGEDGSRSPNFNKAVVEQIEEIVGKATPEDIFDYIYAALHSPSYRKKYREFLKIDFPRVPYPKDKKQFAALGALGKELREIHLLESKKINPNKISYPESGTDAVDKINYTEERVYINSTQYFGDVPEVAWNFYIGGYQPAQKWLKDRKGRALSNTDIEHYQKIIVSLTETSRVMTEIDKVLSN